MSMHTPGPWILATSCSWRRIIAEYGGAHVCMPTVARDGHADMDISDADAALIVAAPLLLEALRRCKFDSLNMSIDDLKFCQAAFAKATGGAP